MLGQISTALVYHSWILRRQKSVIERSRDHAIKRNTFYTFQIVRTGHRSITLPIKSVDISVSSESKEK